MLRVTSRELSCRDLGSVELQRRQRFRGASLFRVGFGASIARSLLAHADKNEVERDAGHRGILGAKINTKRKVSERTSDVLWHQAKPWVRCESN